MQEQPIVYKKSNIIISSKFKGSLLENRLIAIATSRLTVKNNRPYALITMSEIKKFLNIPASDRNIYNKVKRAVKALPSHPVIIEDYDSFNGQNEDSIKGSIVAMSMISTSKYTNGKIEIFFNEDFIPLMMNLKNNFTLLELQTLMKFENDYSFRLYELLRKEVYRIKEDVGYIDAYYSLSELKCLIGVVDINHPSVRMAIEAGKSWDYIVNELKVEKEHKVWGEFERKVLKKAQKEIKELSDICFKYVGKPCGRGGKIIGVTFYVYKNYVQNEYTGDKSIKNGHNKNNDISIFNYDQDVAKLCEEMNDIVTYEQCYDLYKTASYDYDKVLMAYEKSKEQSYIENFMGWMKSCIKGNGYQEKPIPMIDGSVEQGNKVTELLNDYNENKSEISKVAWGKIKEKADFSAFLEYYDLDECLLELTKSSEECIKLYVDWKLKRGVK